MTLEVPRRNSRPDREFVKRRTTRVKNTPDPTALAEGRLVAVPRAKLEIEHVEEKMVAFMLNLAEEDAQTAAIVGITYLDGKLSNIIRDAFIPLDQDTHSSIFDLSKGGILGTFSSKVRIAYAMKLISAPYYEALSHISIIRDNFVHRYAITGFNDPVVIEECKSLVALSPEITDNPGLALTKDEQVIPIFVKAIVAISSSLDRMTKKKRKSISPPPKSGLITGS